MDKENLSRKDNASMMWQGHPDSPASGKGEANAGTSTKAAAAATREEEYQVSMLEHDFVI